ncbi:MAG: hypothetical protein PHQ58_04800 [Rhodoferax sp.]|uniref:hypothetical protein n=1 Tax=Rhodoferax sp. TaxID=50421 RepID=UPI00261EAF08|nr:hypothetical protein [Rhodoferax sp.]MDD2879732.1 hypothetical protein [Rhodoferax sp.]
MKVYIAFSIHGTNCFITATKEIGSIAELPSGMVRVVSRRKNYDPATDWKVNWDGLLTKKGTPYRSHIRVMQRFNELESQGWAVDKTAFLNKFFKKKG